MQTLIKKMESSILKKNNQTERDLIERVKELSCLYGVSKIIANSHSAIEGILLELPHILPPSWQYPEITCSRVIFNNKEYVSENFKASEWKQFAEIDIDNISVGRVEVYYLEEKPLLDEGPFLHEERLLINTIAEMISRAAQRLRTEELLKKQQLALERSHSALKEVLETIEEKQQEAIFNIETNVSKVIFPIITDLESKVNDEEAIVHVRLLKRYIEDITLPFSNSLLTKFSNLSPTEVQLCNMIRNNISSKSIAKIRHVSPSTVYRQRESIRKKLGLRNAKVNLASFLSANFQD